MNSLLLCGDACPPQPHYTTASRGYPAYRRLPRVRATNAVEPAGTGNTLFGALPGGGADSRLHDTTP